MEAARRKARIDRVCKRLGVDPAQLDGLFGVPSKALEGHTKANKGALVYVWCAFLRVEGCQTYEDARRVSRPPFPDPLGAAEKLPQECKNPPGGLPSADGKPPGRLAPGDTIERRPRERRTPWRGTLLRARDELNRRGQK